MKTNCASALLVAASAILLFSCHGKVVRGRGDKSVTNADATVAFNAINISASLHASIIVNPSAPASIQISGYKNLLEHIKTKTENNTLSVYTDLNDGWNLDKHAGTTLTVNVPSLAALELNGATDADLHGNITGSKFALSISGASKVIADNISTTDFTSEVSGAANLQLNGGHVQHASYNLSGATKVYAYPLVTSETTAEISGAGKAEVTANDKLNASISGTGYIHYKGYPAVTKEISGVGSIKDAN